MDTPYSNPPSQRYTSPLTSNSSSVARSPAPTPTPDPFIPTHPPAPDRPPSYSSSGRPPTYQLDSTNSSTKYVDIPLDDILEEFVRTFPVVRGGRNIEARQPRSRNNGNVEEAEVVGPRWPKPWRHLRKHLNWVLPIAVISFMVLVGAGVYAIAVAVAKKDD